MSILDHRLLDFSYNIQEVIKSLGFDISEDFKVSPIFYTLKKTEMDSNIILPQLYKTLYFVIVSGNQLYSGQYEFSSYNNDIYTAVMDNGNAPLLINGLNFNWQGQDEICHVQGFKINY